MHRNIERLTSELQESRDKCDEIREARQDAVRELLNLQDQHQEELKLLKADLQEEASNREGMERRINDLRAEVRGSFIITFVNVLFLLLFVSVFVFFPHRFNYYLIIIFFL